MAKPRRVPVYVVAICDGSGCREILGITDAENLRQAVRRLVLLTEGLRKRDILGTLTLTEVRTGVVVATRRVWP
jgi:hypothetical protein